MSGVNAACDRASGLVAPSAYREVQHFRQWWMWLVVLAIAAFMWVFTLLSGLGLPVFFLVLRLVTEVFADRLVVGLASFRRRAIPLAYNASGNPNHGHGKLI